MRVLGLETSCDETAAAIYDSQQGLLADVVHSQVEIHQNYGGVVPELASRDHIRKLLPLIETCLQQANCTLDTIDAVAYTAGPGLIGALLVGASLGKSLAWARGIPGIAIHHMEGHLLAPLMEKPAPSFPFVALLVSGGHTLLIEVAQLSQYRVLGDTLDDAVGEAFDKTAKMLGLPYPGGPALAKLAQQGDSTRFTFPRPMLNRPGLDFSFSGLKTHVMQVYRKQTQVDEQTRADIAIAFQEAVIDTLIEKSMRALAQVRSSRLVIAGGVSANLVLRQRMTDLSRQEKFKVFFPRLEFSTDNAAMIAFAGAQRLMTGMLKSSSGDVRPRWPLAELFEGVP